MCHNHSQPVRINNIHEGNIKLWMDSWTLTNKFFLTTCPLPEHQKQRVIPYIQSAILNWFSSKEIVEDDAFDLNKFHEIVRNFIFQNRERNRSNLTRSSRTPEVNPQQSPINEETEVNNGHGLEMGIYYNSETDNKGNLKIRNKTKPRCSNKNSLLVGSRKRRAPKYLKDYVKK